MKCFFFGGTEKIHYFCDNFKSFLRRAFIFLPTRSVFIFTYFEYDIIKIRETWNFTFYSIFANLIRRGANENASQNSRKKITEFLDLWVNTCQKARFQIKNFQNIEHLTVAWENITVIWSFRFNYLSYHIFDLTYRATTSQRS